MEKMNLSMWLIVIGVLMFSMPFLLGKKSDKKLQVLSVIIVFIAIIMHYYEKNKLKTK